MIHRTCIRLALVCAVALSVAACETRKEARGYRFDEDRIARLKAGETTQDQVQQIMGSPSSASTFNQVNNVWYYIETQTEAFAFFPEKTRAQRVLAIEFDESAVVKDVRNYDLKDGKPITPVARETATRGKDLGVIEQLFGNLGRFNRPARPPGT